MVKNNKGKERLNSVSETKMSEQKLLREKIITIINEKSNNSKSQYLLFYLVKIFEKMKYKLVSKEEIIQLIKKVYDKDPQFFRTFNNEKFKSKQSISSTLVRIFNKICSKKNNLYKLNERATLKYLKKSLNSEDNSSKTPYKIFSIKKEIKKEKTSEEKDEEIKIKQEDIKIKEEKEENLLIKEEKKENEENMSIEIIEENKENNEKNLFHLFNNKKLYDDFYLYLGEEEQYEKLQEIIEKYMEKYNNNKIEENNKFKILGIMGKIINIKKKLVELFKAKKEYENLSSELEIKRNMIKYFLEIFYINIKAIKTMQNHSNLSDIVLEAKNIYKEDKKRQNIIFGQMINKTKDIRNSVMNSDNIKNEIISELESVVEDFKKNSNISIENINELGDIAKILVNGRYSYIIREDISEDIIEKYNKCINMIEESLNLDNN